MLAENPILRLEVGQAKAGGVAIAPNRIAIAQTLANKNLNAVGILEGFTCDRVLPNASLLNILASRKAHAICQQNAAANSSTLEAMKRCQLTSHNSQPARKSFRIRQNLSCLN